MIIAIANQKGGVGKTTLTIHLAAYLGRAGRQVIVVDADPQGNATSWLTDGDVTRAGMFELLVVGAPAPRVLCTPANGVAAGPGAIRLLPGNHRTGEAFIFLAATQKPFETVTEALRPLDHEADVVLIDMPPSRAAGFAETLHAADWAIVPTQLERLSLEGVVFMAETCQALAQRYKARRPRLLGIVPNMTRANTREHQDQMQDLIAAFGPTVWPPVPLSVRVAEAAALGKTVFDLPDAGPVAGALTLVGERLVANA